MPLKIFRRKGSDIWHYRGTVGDTGHRYRLRGSCRTTDKALAQRIAAEKESRHWKRRLDGPESVTTFANCAALYRAAGKPTRYLEQIEDYWKDTPVRRITAGAIRESCAKLYPNVKPATWNRQVIVPTQAVINFANESELCPPIRVKRFKVATKIKEPASWTWVEAFRSTAVPQLGALAAFMFLTGARISEALSILWTEVDFGSRTVKIRMGKIGGEERIANLQPQLVVILANLERKNDYVFRYTSRHNIRTQWESAIRRAGIKRLTPHCMRHGFATEMLRAGYDVKTVAVAGGWKDAATVLKTYAHAIRDIRITDALIGADLTKAGANNAKTIDKITA